MAWAARSAAVVAGSGDGPLVLLRFGAMEKNWKGGRLDPQVVCLGLDIRWGGSFGQFRGLYEEFPDRVIDMPISESLMVGAAVGAAATGMRPVVSMSFVEFSMGAMDELVNQAAKLRYMSDGQMRVPIVVRVGQGPLGSFGAQHSQALHGWLANVPGLVRCSPFPRETAGCRRRSLWT